MQAQTEQLQPSQGGTQRGSQGQAIKNKGTQRQGMCPKGQSKDLRDWVEGPKVAMTTSVDLKGFHKLRERWVRRETGSPGKASAKRAWSLSCV